MKAFAIVQKNLLRHFRSAFALVMMFVAPLMVTGLLYLAFGDLGAAGFSVPPTRLQIVNLDQPGAAPQAVGKLVVEMFRQPDVARYVTLSEAGDAGAARAAIERQETDVALIIPADFTQAVFSSEGKSALVMIHDPAKTLGPAIVRDILAQLVDGFAGAKIALSVAEAQLTQRGQAGAPAQEALMQYVAWVQSVNAHDSATISALQLRQPPSQTTPSNAPSMVSLLMAGMMIFFVFFTGAQTAEILISEDEEGTLARLFTTPTPYAEVLAGYLLTVFVTLIVQTAVLLGVASLLFHIHWGAPASVALVAFGMIAAAGGFGLALMSLIKTTRQAGPILGIALTLSGVAGGLMSTPFQNLPAVYDTINLLTPHGWTLRAWRLALTGATAGDVVPTVAVLLAIGGVCFGIALLRFRRRFA